MSEVNALTDILFADLSARWLWVQIPTAWRGFADWWRSELLAILPESLIAWLGGTAGPVIRLGIETNGVRVEAVSATGRVEHSGTIAWSDYSVPALDRYLSRIGMKRSDQVIGIVLPPTAFFRRSFEIPARARERLDAITWQELEHRTPFRAESVHLDMVIEPRQRDSKTLTIRQTIVRRDLVEAAARRFDLALADIHFVAPAMNDNDSLVSSILLRPEADRAVPLTKRLLHILTMAAVVITGLDAALFWWKHERTITTVEAQVAVVREHAVVVRGVEQEIVRIRLALRALEKRRASLSTADVWQETSRLLPNHSWATDWRFREGSVSIAGFSAAATELVGIFEKSPLFAQASLDAPITFDAANGRDHFSLVVRTRADALPSQL